MDLFKKGFLKTAAIGKSVQQVMKGWSPQKQEAGRKLVQKMTEMKQKGVPLSEAKGAIQRAYSPSAKHTEYIKSLKATTTPKAPAPKPTTELSAYAKNQANRMNPASAYRKEGIGTEVRNRVPGVKKDTPF